jgi:MFS superfamily sulfate permease-like transporter
MTFLNKAGLKRILREVPRGSSLTIDMTATRILDHDVHEVIRDFATHAKADAIELVIKGATGPQVSLTRSLPEEPQRDSFGLDKVPSASLDRASGD